jgi:20S proteasome alpha/beta subunit
LHRKILSFVPYPSDVKYGRSLGFGFHPYMEGADGSNLSETDYDTIPADTTHGRLSAMSISVAIIGTDGIVLAADSRVTSKSYTVEMSLLHNAGKKLWVKRIGDKFSIGVASVANNAGFQHWLIDYYLNVEVKAKEDKLTDFDVFIFGFSSYIKQMVELYAKDMPDKFISRDAFDLGFTVVGYMGKEPQIHYLQSSHSFSPDIKHDYYVAGVPSIGDYWMMKLWKHLFDDKSDSPKPKVNTEILKRLAVMIVSETSKLNNSVGGRISMVVLRGDGTAEIIKQQEMDSIKKQIAIITGEKRLLESLSERQGY